MKRELDLTKVTTKGDPRIRRPGGGPKRRHPYDNMVNKSFRIPEHFCLVLETFGDGVMSQGLINLVVASVSDEELADYKAKWEAQVAAKKG